MSAAAGVVSAADLLAAAGASGPIAYKPDDLDYDLGLMAAFDPHPLDPADLAADQEEALLQSATDNAQLLVKHLFELATDVTEVGPVAMLPERTTKLPRWKPVPKAKPLTRWQKFALEKGIQKKKKSRMVWDEDAGEFKPRWGYKGANDDGTKEWLVEAKPGDDGTVDPWKQKALEKKSRIISNQLNQVKNLQRTSRGADAAAGVEGDAALFNRASSKALPGAAAAAKALYVDPFAPTKRSGGALVAPKVREAIVPVTDGLAPAPRAKRARLDADASDGAAAAAPGRKGSKRERSTGASARVATTADGERVLVPAGLPSVPVGEGRIGVLHRDGKEARAKPSDTKAIKQARLKMAQVSTASMGKFDAALPGEPARPKDPKRHTRLANEVPAVTEAARHKDILRKILGGADDREIPSAGAAAATAIGPTGGAGGRRGGRAEGGAGTGGGRGRGRSASAGGGRGRSASGGRKGGDRKGGDSAVSGHKRKRS